MRHSGKRNYMQENLKYIEVDLYEVHILDGDSESEVEECVTVQHMEVSHRKLAVERANERNADIWWLNFKDDDVGDTNNPEAVERHGEGWEAAADELTSITITKG